MHHTTKTYSFYWGRLVITADALKNLNLIDVCCALFRHACGFPVCPCAANHPDSRRSFWDSHRFRSTCKDRHGTRYEIISEPDLSRTLIQLCE